MKTLLFIITISFSMLLYSQEKQETEKEETNSSLNIKDLLSSEKGNVTVISYNELPGAVKNRLQELKIQPELIESVKVLELKEKTLFTVSFLQDDKLKTLRIKPNGQIENG